MTEPEWTIAGLKDEIDAMIAEARRSDSLLFHRHSGGTWTPDEVVEMHTRGELRHGRANWVFKGRLEYIQGLRKMRDAAYNAKTERIDALSYPKGRPEAVEELATFECSGCMTTYGEDLLHMTCGECAADFCHPCWTKHYDTKEDELACMPGLSAEALGADAESHNNCPGTVGGEMCHHPSHKEGRRE